MLHYFAFALMKIYNVVNRMPRFVLMIVSGAVASFVMRLLHRAPPTPPAGASAQAPTASSVSAKSETGTGASVTSAASSSTATSSPSKKAKQRKAGKK